MSSGLSGLVVKTFLTEGLWSLKDVGTLEAAGRVTGVLRYGK